MDIRELQHFIIEHRAKWSFGDSDKIFGNETPEQLMLGLSAEIGELAGTVIREYRYGRPRGGMDDKSSLPNEVADVLVLLLALCNACDVDPEEVLKNKVAMNDARFCQEKASISR